MAWARTARTSDPGATSSEPTWTTASFTPTADSLLVITVGLMHNGNSTAAADTEVISVSGGSLTWTERTGNDGDSRVTGVWGGQHAVFTAPVGGSPSSMTIVIDIDSAAGVDWFPGWIVLDITGHDITTPIAAANPPNSSSERKSGDDAETHTHTLTNAPESGNLVLVTMATQNDVSSPYTIPTGFTSITNLSGVNAHSFVAYHETTTTAAITCDDLGDDVFLVMASGLELTPSSGTAHTETSTDPVGVTDVITVVKAIAVEITDPVGVTDLVTRVAPANRTITEAVGVTDLVATAKAIPVEVTDAVGVTDVVVGELTAGVQFLRPDADLVVAGWTTAPLWSKIDEVTPSDADFVSEL